MKQLVDISVGLTASGDHWKEFEQVEDRKPELSLTYHFDRPIFNGIEMYDSGAGGRVLRSGDRVVTANADWTRIDYYADRFFEDEPLLIPVLQSYLADRGGLLFHSSLVDFEGNGLMFLGPSGIGKTTQAELWQKCTGAEILNGDLVFVREKSDGFYGYGSPWHGSSPYFLNRKVPVRAMILLSQAEENTLTRLSGLEILQRLMTQAYLPTWDPDKTERCLATLDRMLSQIPVYHLACRPDEDAVQTVKKELNL